MNIEDKQKRAISYYDKFSIVYDILSSKSYYHKARELAVSELHLKQESTVLNLPVGTGQNLEYFQEYLNNTGLIIGIDLSVGMLSKAKIKIEKNNWSNVYLLNNDAVTTNRELLSPILKEYNSIGINAVLIDLGLSGFPDWKKCIDSYLDLLPQKGCIVIMDWYIEKKSIRGELIKWIGRGEVNRPIWQYLETKVDNFNVDSSFNFGGVFVASGLKK